MLVKFKGEKLGHIRNNTFKIIRGKIGVERGSDGFALSTTVLVKLLTNKTEKIIFDYGDEENHTTYTITLNDFIRKGTPKIKKHKKHSPNRFKPQYLYDIQVVCDRKYMSSDDNPDSQTTL